MKAIYYDSPELLLRAFFILSLGKHLNGMKIGLSKLASKLLSTKRRRLNLIDGVESVSNAVVTGNSVNTNVIIIIRLLQCSLR